MFGTSVLEYYDYVWSLRDPRVENWPLMHSIVPTLILSSLYLIICIFIGPLFMRDRKPYEFKNLMQFYNLSQVIISAFICYEISATGWFSHYNWLCQPVELESNNLTWRMTIACYLYFLNKFVEFADTFFFIARKKFKNVSRLQLIHHSIMPIYGFIIARWLPGGHETFGGMFNCLVHVIMYGYYFLAALGPHMQKYLWWKKYLTSFQMIQFVCVFVKSLIVFLGFAKCGYPWQFSGLMALLMLIFFLLFLEFYIQEYSAKSAAKKAKNNNKNE